MCRYNLRMEDGLWTVVDATTQRPAELNGVPMARMTWREACDMVDLLNNLDRISFMSKRYETSTRATA
ncbi:hypothetical protein [Rhizobium grahamii]|uniref:Uncharacterized protein n=2 Tax=Rhizobium grahamii TaxID=1120045 RepID=S3IHV9_9HYPH|nr:hypothetical protein [Rhizobium grahamii]EPE98488.1 hypothetical protein RGCCGE502_08675 [Rhizobium grahamii CCGE 502]RDJ13450.1 hypothetical protein B5K06_08645 [Rhizobium grahamii]